MKSQNQSNWSFHWADTMSGLQLTTTVTAGLGIIKSSSTREQYDQPLGSISSRGRFLDQRLSGRREHPPHTTSGKFEALRRFSVARTSKRGSSQSNAAKDPLEPMIESLRLFLEGSNEFPI
ncbi:hypothetical protein AFLA_011901 [Aspergillus flavus NRRL3357]|nr:hypothetical protein AFLA_011901 [Aspergillus flavus NRRL3357]